MSDQKEVTAARLEGMAGLAKALARDYAAGRLWPGEFAAQAAVIKTLLEQAMREVGGR